MRYLVTGGSGYFGGELKRALLEEGNICVNVDLCKDMDCHPNLVSLQADVSNPATIESLFAQYAPYDGVFHCAAMLQHKIKNKKFFYLTNVESTRLLAENCVKYGTKNIVYISSNCVYGKINGVNISENSELNPFEEYGRTKVLSEKILHEYEGRLNSTILRPPTIIGNGRLGILSIVFDFIRENRKLWLIGSGQNRYQFIYTPDLINACKLAVNYPYSAVFNVGCDRVPSLNEIFSELILSAKSRSKIYHLPYSLVAPIMKLCYKLGISPLGPYQYNMISNTFIGDTTAIKNSLGWRPTKSNIEMIIDNYHYYTDNYEQIHQDNKLSGHRRAGKAGIIYLVKKLS